MSRAALRAVAERRVVASWSDPGRPRHHWIPLVVITGITQPQLTMLWRAGLIRFDSEGVALELAKPEGSCASYVGRARLTPKGKRALAA